MPRLAWIALALLAACMPPRYVRDYPRWRITGGQALTRGCARVDAFVRKSGKTGIGVTLALRSVRDCDVAITTAALVFADGRRAAAAPDALRLAPLRGRSLRYHWLPIPFDNDAAWDRGANDAVLELALTVAGEPVTWRMPVQQRFDRRWQPNGGPP